jgi:predicted metal-dependent phosphotriesterase family hydrolase
MAIVRTVTGDVEAAELGPTTMHEHIFGDFTVWQEDPQETASLAAVAVDPNARVEMGVLAVIHRNPPPSAPDAR